QGIGRTALQEAIVAFSNADGGVILVGVADDGALDGRRFDDGVEKTCGRSSLNADPAARRGTPQPPRNEIDHPCPGRARR
ncbi:MAG: helix-turn-helix domain-containing protein, partial [Polyangiales bacterium]